MRSATTFELDIIAPRKESCPLLQLGPVDIDTVGFFEVASTSTDEKLSQTLSANV